MTENKNFRTVERRSNLRANIFLVESILVLAVYLYVLYNNITPSPSSPMARNKNSNFVSPPRAHHHILAVFGVIYMIRLNFMTRWLLNRELSIEELTIVILVWIPGILASFSLLAQQSKEDSAGVVSSSYSMMMQQHIVAIILYSTGSFVNTYSELQRKKWKERHPENKKGRCYMEGLFSLSRNINYFGDTVLFAGWAVATGSLWNIWVPIMMGLSFYFYHIPDKEKYLEKRYAKEWPIYKAKTPWSFVPFVC